MEQYEQEELAYAYIVPPLVAANHSPFNHSPSAPPIAASIDAPLNISYDEMSSGEICMKYNHPCITLFIKISFNIYFLLKFQMPKEDSKMYGLRFYSLSILLLSQSSPYIQYIQWLSIKLPFMTVNLFSRRNLQYIVLINT